MNSIQKIFISAFILFISSGIILVNAQNKTLFKEDFKKKKLRKEWTTINGEWIIKDRMISGTRNSHWAILVCKKQMPDNYILTFSSLVDSTANLFEVMLNLQEEKFLGILLNQLEENVAIEDRSLFSGERFETEGTYIRTTGHIGKLPEVINPNQYIWLNWKIQKTGNKIFVWINDQPIILYEDTWGIIQENGRFGFAVSGSADITNIKLVRTKGKKSLPPKNFEGRPYRQNFFLFSE